ncbi:MAG: hypothetical protein M0R22_00845 [Dehalococcoidia bacterium]|jgi:hypothetical protein|nr:hypothetical protein [Dehalococcoidia bacterium]
MKRGSDFEVYFIDIGMLCGGYPLDYKARFNMSTGKTHCYAFMGRLLGFPVLYSGVWK